jgi:RND family efflux transporter MFP subunit
MNSQYAQKAGCHGKFSPQAGIANYRRVAPTRQPNATYRTREYLTDAEIARLQAAAEAGNRARRQNDPRPPQRHIPRIWSWAGFVIAAVVTWDRDSPLLQKGWVTPQQGDTDRLNLQSRVAGVAVAEANASAQENLLKVLQQNRDYASVVAPFDGVITQRNVDVGSLVQGSAANGTFMFEIMQNNVIRVWVYVPQDSAFGVAPGIDAIIRVPELPDREFSGKVTRIADALQSGTRTLLTEIDLTNPDGALAPGVYCTVELHIPRKTASLLVPADAIIFNRNGMQVAVVNNGKAELRRVKVKRDLGTRVELDSGIRAGDQVILNPPVTLVDGSKLRALTEPPRI